MSLGQAGTLGTLGCVLATPACRDPEDLLLTALLRVLPIATIFQGWSSGASWQVRRQ